MARIAGVDLPRGKRVQIALTYIYGIGHTRAKEIVDTCGIEAARRTQDLSDEDVNKWFNWRFVKFDGSLRKLKPLMF